MEESLTFETRKIGDYESCSLFAEWSSSDMLSLTQVREGVAGDPGSHVTIDVSIDEARKLMQFIFLCLMRHSSKE